MTNIWGEDSIEFSDFLDKRDEEKEGFKEGPQSGCSISESRVKSGIRAGMQGKCSC